MERNTVKPVYSENFSIVPSKGRPYKSIYLGGNLSKMKFFLRLSSDSVFTDFTVLCSVNPVKTEPVYNGILF